MKTIDDNLNMIDLAKKKSTRYARIVIRLIQCMIRKAF